MLLDFLQAQMPFKSSKQHQSCEVNTEYYYCCLLHSTYEESFVDIYHILHKRQTIKCSLNSSIGYHWAEQEVSNPPLFPHVEIRSHSTSFESEWIRHSLDSWRLYVIHSSCTYLPLGIDINPNGLEHIRRMCNFKYVWTRWQQCQKSAIISTTVKMP